jgi:signal transduction histidine kinase
MQRSAPPPAAQPESPPSQDALEGGRLLANVGHELRTPLNSILGFAQLLAQDPEGRLGERERRYLGHLTSSARQLQAMIADLLDLARLQAGHALPLETADFSLAEVVEEALARVEPQALARGLRTSALLAPGLLVHGDRARTLQILLNLLGTAVRLTPEGGRITVSSYLHGGEVGVSVADTGIGLPDDRVEDAFGELGLAVSRRLARLMGGDLRVRTRSGSGSVLTLALPAGAGLRAPSA